MDILDQEKRNVFIHPMLFDETGHLTETDLVVISGKPFDEAIAAHFGTQTSEVGDASTLLGTASVIISGKIVSRRIYKLPNTSQS